MTCLTCGRAKLCECCYQCKFQSKAKVLWGAWCCGVVAEFWQDFMKFSWRKKATKSDEGFEIRHRGLAKRHFQPQVRIFWNFVNFDESCLKMRSFLGYFFGYFFEKGTDRGMPWNAKHRTQAQCTCTRTKCLFWRCFDHGFEACFVHVQCTCTMFVLCFVLEKSDWFQLIENSSKHHEQQHWRAWCHVRLMCHGAMTAMFRSRWHEQTAWAEVVFGWHASQCERLWNWNFTSEQVIHYSSISLICCVNLSVKSKSLHLCVAVCAMSSNLTFHLFLCN